MVGDYAPPRPNRFEIDMAAIAHNLGQIRALVGTSTKIIAALKGDGYGFGLIPVARTMVQHGADMIALADIAEAASVRLEGIELPILLYAGNPFDADAVQAMVAYDLMPTVLDITGAETLSTQAQGPIRCFVKVDVGLERLGALPMQAVALVEAVTQLPKLELAGLYAHMDVPDGHGVEDYIDWQWQAFDGVCSQLKSVGIQIPLRLLSSSAVLRFSSAFNLDAVDPGHLLFGLMPAGPVKLDIDLKPAFVALSSRLIHTRMVERTEFIDFSPINLRPGDRFGVIPFGLRDGISALTCGEVLVRGKRVPIAGSFCMEHTRIDLSLIPDASVGDEVVLIGRQGSEAITLREVTDSQNAPAIMPALSVGRGVQRVLR